MLLAAIAAPEAKAGNRGFGDRRIDVPLQIESTAKNRLTTGSLENDDGLTQLISSSGPTSKR